MTKDPKHIKELIANCNVRQAIELMVNLAQDLNSNMYSKAVLLSYRYKKVSESISLGFEGIFSSEELRVVYSIIEFSDELLKKIYLFPLRNKHMYL